MDGDAPGSAAEPFESAQDDLDYLKPSRFQRRLPWMAVFAAWGLTLAVLGGLVAYVVVAEDSIMAQFREDRPRVEIGEDAITLRREAAPSESAADAVREEREESAADRTEGLEHRPAVAAAPEAAAPDSFGALLHPHPDPGLIDQGPTGPLPVIGPDGRQPWRVYSRPYNALDTRPKIALVIADLGLSTERTQAALNLPGAVSLAFAPYSRKLAEWIDAARSDGHEVLLTLPMEPADFPQSDPGPFALMASFDAEQNINRLEWVLSRATGYVGLINHQGSGLSASRSAMQPLMGNLKARGLLYLDLRQDDSSIAPMAAADAGVPHAQADIVLDDELSRTHILGQLRLAETLARTNGSAIVVGRPYPLTLNRVELWLRGLAENGLALVPVSGIIAERTAS